MLPKPFDKEKIFKDLDDAWHYFYYFDRLSELKSDDAYYINALMNYIEYLNYVQCLDNYKNK
jgi:hypothetical protein